MIVPSAKRTIPVSGHSSLPHFHFLFLRYPSPSVVDLNPRGDYPPIRGNPYYDPAQFCFLSEFCLRKGWYSMYCVRQGSGVRFATRLPRGSRRPFPNPITNVLPVYGFDRTSTSSVESITAGLLRVQCSKPRRKPCPEPCRNTHRVRSRLQFRFDWFPVRGNAEPSVTN